MKTFTEAEINDIREHWSDLYKDYSILSHMNRTNVQIDNKAYQLGLSKSQRVKELILLDKRNLCIKRNKTVLGSDITVERIKTVAQHFTSKQEFREKETSLYVTARRMGILDEICQHMITGGSFNYPQTLLYLCIKRIFKNSTVRYNDRLAIYPKEIDVYVVDEQIGFEYDGKNWHNSNRDLNKDTLCKEKNIKLFRIKELRKYKQLPFIVDSLRSFGFDTTKLDLDEIVNEAFAMRQTEDDMKRESEKYQSLGEFKKNSPKLYSFLSKNGKLKEYTKHIPRKKTPTEEEIIVILNQCDRKLQFINEFRRYYNEMMKKKYKTCLELYHTKI